MNQEKIWSYFQNEGSSSFDGALPRYKYILNDIKNRLPPKSHILNIGVGSGKLELMLKEAGFTVSALDPDQVAISKLKKLDIRALTGIAEDIPFESSSFDGVIASEVLEHLEFENSKKAALEIQRILKPNGFFFGTVPYKESLEDNLTVCPHCAERFHRWGHRQSFTEEKLISVICEGFEINSLSRRSFVKWEGGIVRIIKSLIKWLLGRLGEPIASPHFYFVFKKSLRIK